MKRTICLICILGLLAAAGCSTGRPKDTQTSLGVDNAIAGFLFNFDRRDATVKLVKDRNKGIYPSSIRWQFGEGLKVDEEAPEYYSEDPDLIKDIYYALSNTITIGNSYNHSAETPFFIEFTLEDGSICRFDFVSLNTVRLSEQNYVIESDGNLWQLIRKACKNNEPVVTEKKKTQKEEKVKHEEE